MAPAKPLAPGTSPPATRRTQRERRESTIARLLDATADALIELGYARTTIREICTRAGVSDGGLFRHFRSRLELIAACADHVAERTLEDLRALADATPGTSQTPEAIVRAVREATRHPTSYVWQELLVAARTDAELRRRIEPVTRRYVEDAQQLMMSISGTHALTSEQAVLWQQLLTHVFNSEAMIAAVAPDDEAERRLVAFVTKILTEATG